MAIRVTSRCSHQAKTRGLKVAWAAPTSFRQQLESQRRALLVLSMSPSKAPTEQTPRFAPKADWVSTMHHPSHDNLDF
jgi:hypothetical protein